jgi:catechol 2,3-dioxygenase-like lactoylglutathione lyase family enzyme
MANAFQITPFLRVPDIDAAIAFFCETLGFDLGVKIEHYAFVTRGRGVSIRLVEDHEATRGNGAYRVYIDVEDVDALYAELKPKLDTLPWNDVCPPFDQDYGMRELTVVGPDGDVIAFGQDISSGS